MVLEDIALTLTPGLGLKGVVRLLEVFSTAQKIFAATSAELIHFAQLRPDVAESIVRRVAFGAARKELEYCARHSITPIASTDEAYPPLLLEVPDYPHVLYVVGDPAALLRRNVSIIGTRRMTSYGDRMCNDLVRDLGEALPNLSIVSGLAFGIDSAAHRAALQYDIPTVAVVANALPAVTPSQHTALAAEIIERGGAIVSECHSATKQRGSLYIARNRIIAALSGVTVVVESPYSGGSMVTASIAAGYERLVMAIPGRLSDKSSAGCNMLIRNSQAQLYLSAEQLVREMMWDSPAPADRVAATPLTVELTDAQRAVVECFDSDDPLSLSLIGERTGFSVAQLSVIMLELELEGVLRMLPGDRYEMLRVVTA